MLQRAEPRGDLYSVAVVSEDVELLRNLLNAPEVDAGCRAVIQRTEDRGFQTYIFTTQEKIRELEREKRLRVTIQYNATEEGRKRQQEVGKEDRFEAGRIVPRGFGRKV